MYETAIKKIVKGICNLVHSFTPMRGIEPDKAIQPPSFSDEVAASQSILQKACAAIDRFTGLGRGFAGHMLSFS